MSALDARWPLGRYQRCRGPAWAGLVARSHFYVVGILGADVRPRLAEVGTVDRQRITAALAVADVPVEIG